MKRKLYILALTGVMALNITACGNKKDVINTSTEEYQTASSNNTVSENTTEPEPESTTELSTEETTTTDAESYNPDFTFTQMPKSMFMWALERQSIYEIPTVDSKLVYFSQKDEKFEVLAVCKENGWYKIQCMDTVGYIDSNYLTDIDPKQAKNTPKGDVASTEPTEDTFDMGMFSDAEFSDTVTDTASKKPVKPTGDKTIADTELKTDAKQNGSTETPTATPKPTTDKPVDKPVETVTNSNLPSFNKTLYAVNKYDEKAVYWYYIVGKENSDEMHTAMKTAQTNLNALKSMYYQNIKVCDIGTYAQGTVALYIAETFDTNTDYNTNAKTRTNAITSNIATYK